jgi:hypothetical protein
MCECANVWMCRLQMCKCADYKCADVRIWDSGYADVQIFEYTVLNLLNYPCIFNLHI